MDATRKARIVCKFLVSSKGIILQTNENCDSIFACQVYEGINFFELMASYNYKYLQDKFEEDPLIGMSRSPKQKIVIRFSLKESDICMRPIIVTAKITFHKKPNEIDLDGNFAYATICARRSSDKSSKKLQERIQLGIQEAQNAC
jgi:hypothetical protein